MPLMQSKVEDQSKAEKAETPDQEEEKIPLETVVKELGADLERGLTSDEAGKRLEKYGPNAIPEKHVSPVVKFLSFFWGPIPWMIEIAAVLSGVVHHWTDFIIIMVMLLLNSVVGFWEEFKADTAIQALKQRLALKARVLRDGKWSSVEAKSLVPGDVVEVQLGNIVPADLKLAGGEFLSLDQSALTGESLPVDKHVGDVAYAGSIVRMGQMRAVVSATGVNTFFGKTAMLVEKAEKHSHFQDAVLRIGNFLILNTLWLVALIVIVALFRGDPMVDTILFALVLTVAAIPVALPAVLSVTMAVGASTLAAMRAIVSRLVSIEEMAGMDVLCSDKTGTLTKNQLVLGEPVVMGGSTRDELIESAALASQREAPDAIDEAIFQALGDKAKLAGYKVVKFTPFDPVHKRAEADVQHNAARFKAPKGAPQVILELARPDASTRNQAESQVEVFAKKGYRTLGVARSEADGAWRFLGLLPMFDPPRDDSRATIDVARSMGLKIKMVTGDHEAIARQIAGVLGLGRNIVKAEDAFPGGHIMSTEAIERADGFAQVFPDHKFKIVKALQAEGHLVGMTGDGVNDAPALKQADVGIAVSGATDAARAAADLVLTEPGLSVITRAVEEARRIFERMNAYAIYRIAETIRVLLFMTLSIIAYNFYPVTAVMIVLIAILNDFPIMMIAYDNQPVAPRPVRWDMHRVLMVSSALGLMGVIESFLLLWIAKAFMALPAPIVQTVIFLKLLVAGHLTIYVTRNVGKIWDRPWPNWKFFTACETTQAIGTLAAVYGWFVTPIGWEYALGVWGYALVWFLVESAVKISTYRMLRSGTRLHERHLARIGASFNSHAP